MGRSPTISATSRKTVHDLPVAECLEFFRKALGQELQEATLQKSEHPMELLELGETMVTKYVEGAAPLITARRCRIASLGRDRRR